MERRWIAPVAGIVMIPMFVLALWAAQSRPTSVEDVSAALLRLHREVLTMGTYPGEDFIYQQFFTGKEDDDDTNKDVYVAVLIQPELRGDRMEIRVTRMERSPRDPQVSKAIQSRSMVCRVAGPNVLVVFSEFGDKETPAILRDLLKAVLQKKELLKRERGQVSTFYVYRRDLTPRLSSAACGARSLRYS